MPGIPKCKAIYSYRPSETEFVIPVRFDEGWSVNSNTAQVGSSNNGFISVRIEEVPLEIRLDYRPKGLYFNWAVGTGAYLLLFVCAYFRGVQLSRCKPSSGELVRDG